MEEKKFIYVLLGLAISLFISTGILGYLFYHSSQRLQEANNVIAARTDEIQEFDKQLGLAESNLRHQEDLILKYEEETRTFDQKFKDMQDKYRLKLRNREQTIASLQGKINGGQTIITVGNGTSGEFSTIIEVPKEVCNNQKIGYQWEDDKSRFKLKDPDIFEENNEEFSYKQHFELKGYVFSDESGNIQVKKVKLKEVYPTKDRFGETVYQEVENSDISLVSSKFEYTNKIQNDKHLFDMVTLRPIATFDTSIMPGVGLEIINLGKYFDYLNFGLYGKAAFDMSDPLGGSLQNSRLGLGVNYHLIPPVINTNFAVGASISTPFNDLGKWVLTLDLTLYLTEDLKPFSWLQ